MKHGNLVIRDCGSECPTLKDVTVKCCTKDFCNNSKIIKYSSSITLISLSILLFLKFLE